MLYSHTKLDQFCCNVDSLLQYWLNLVCLREETDFINVGSGPWLSDADMEVDEEATKANRIINYCTNGRGKHKEAMLVYYHLPFLKHITFPDFKFTETIYPDQNEFS